MGSSSVTFKASDCWLLFLYSLSPLLDFTCKLCLKYSITLSITWLVVGENDFLGSSMKLLVLSCFFPFWLLVYQILPPSPYLLLDFSFYSCAPHIWFCLMARALWMNGKLERLASTRSWGQTFRLLDGHFVTQHPAIYANSHGKLWKSNLYFTVLCTVRKQIRIILIFLGVRKFCSLYNLSKPSLHDIPLVAAN